VPIDNVEKSTNKAVAWFLTVNNPTPEDEDVQERLTEADLLQSTKYVKWAVENGEANGVRHIHIYLHFDKQQRFSAIKKIWAKAHIEEPVGTPRQNIEYIGNPEYCYSQKHPVAAKRGRPKGGTCEYVKEYGSTEGIRLNQSQGSASNIDNRLLAAKALLDAGKELHSLYDADFPLMIRYASKLSQYMTLKGLVAARDARDVSNRNEEQQREEERKLVRDGLNQAIPFPDDEVCF
jgi:hypothetical protein